jgi:hypothetical protein
MCLTVSSAERISPQNDEAFRQVATTFARIAGLRLLQDLEVLISFLRFVNVLAINLRQEVLSKQRAALAKYRRDPETVRWDR